MVNITVNHIHSYMYTRLDKRRSVIKLKVYTDYVICCCLCFKSLCVLDLYATELIYLIMFEMSFEVRKMSLF